MKLKSILFQVSLAMSLYSCMRDNRSDVVDLRALSHIKLDEKQKNKVNAEFSSHVKKYMGRLEVFKNKGTDKHQSSKSVNLGLENICFVCFDLMDHTVGKKNVTSSDLNLRIKKGDGLIDLLDSKETIYVINKFLAHYPAPSSIDIEQAAHILASMSVEVSLAFMEKSFFDIDFDTDKLISDVSYIHDTLTKQFLKRAKHNQ